MGGIKLQHQFQTKCPSEEDGYLSSKVLEKIIYITFLVMKIVPLLHALRVCFFDVLVNLNISTHYFKRETRMYYMSSLYFWYSVLV